MNQSQYVEQEEVDLGLNCSDLQEFGSAFIGTMTA
jgi:hypothetical protein